nr:type I polyketide synthase [Streptomyces sp. SBT349]
MASEADTVSSANEEKLRHFLKKTMADLRTARQRLAETEARLGEPIAIVGMACRLPGGVATAEDMWRLVSGGVDAIGPFPTDRGWDLAEVYDRDAGSEGRATPVEGGFLAAAGEFDAGLFGISPREALGMDPQQRQLLEVAWETLEHAGIAPTGLRGSRTGVYAGASPSGYGEGEWALAETAGHSLTGGSMAVLSGRIAYALGLEGPAVTVDTACSSSLVATHLAVQALRAGECDLALAGGVTVMAQPTAFGEFSRQGGLAPDGRCKPFAAAADGTGWSEGAGLLLLERLSDARRAGRRVLAVVRGSAINQDGASNGLTAPNGPSQQRVIRDALGNAGIAAADVDMLEAHGTGTRMGDPIEAQALLATYGKDRPAGRPLLLGTLKSNFGHTQAAAGVAGVIKSVLAMAHGEVPPTLHVDEPTPFVDWSSGAMELVTEGRPWPATDRPRRAAVSAFGISGTNAHLILEQAPEEPRAEPDDGQAPPAGRLPWVLSAGSPHALRHQARRLLAHLERSPAPAPADVGLSLAVGRAALDHRAVVWGRDHRELTEQLGALAAGGTGPAATGATPAPEAGGTAFLFTGQGAQRPGMGRDLYRAFPVFAEEFDRVCAAFGDLLPSPLRDTVLATDTATAVALDGTRLAQPALFAYETALYRLWRSFGVTPDFLIGHSLGEITAAHVSGVLSLPDAATLVTARATLMQALPDGGAMVAIQATEAEALTEIAARPGAEERVSLAAVNGPASVVISGDEPVVEEIAAAFAARDRHTGRLRVSHAFHSPRMEPMLDPFARVLGRLAFGHPSIPVVSNVTGRVAEPGELGSPRYWADQVRRPVRFSDGLRRLRDADVTTFVEIGPDAVLTAMAEETLTGQDPATGPAARVVALPSQRRGRSEVEALASALTSAFVAGLPVDWRAFFPRADGQAAPTVELPTYAFTRERYWLDSRAHRAERPTGHRILGPAVPAAGGGRTELTGTVSLVTHPWLADHVVRGTVLLPGTAFVELAAHAGDELGCPVLDELIVERALEIPEHGAVALRVCVEDPDPSGRRAVLIHARPDGAPASEPWTRHGSGTLAAKGRAPRLPAPAVWPPEGAAPVDIDGCYARWAEAGVALGPAFRGLRAVWRRGEEVFAEVALGEALAAASDGYVVHPVLLDMALHSIGLGDFGEGKMPFSWTDVHIVTREAASLRVAMVPAASGEGVSVTVTDPAGALVAAVGAVVLWPIGAEPAAPADGANGHLLQVDWRPLPPAAGPPRANAPGWGALGEFGIEPPGAAARYRDLEQLAAALDAGGEPPPRAVLWGVPPADEPLAAGARATLRAVLAQVKAWLADDRWAGHRLVVVTRDAVAADPGGDADATQAPVWGLVRSAQAEHPDRFVLLDWDGDPASAAAVPEALACGEPQVALRRGRVHVPRLAPAAPERLTPPAGATAWRLEAGERGTLEHLALVPCDAGTVPLAAGEVRVAVRVAGMNFRDLLNTLGVLPPGAGHLGHEGAGVVAEVGPGVEDLAPGDRVMGMWPGAFGPLAVADRRLLARVPGSWSFAQAATVPLAFLTAYHGLVGLAEARRGETVLVHAAAGGVGMAAVQLARHLGLRVLATASPGKWDVLRAAGLADDEIASSRTTDFEERFRAATGGRGADIVLNATAGELLDASLRSLAPGGRFVEMGVTDLRDPSDIARDHPGAAYLPFVLTDLGPAHLGRMLTEVLALCARGVLTPLPVEVWDVRRAPEAFRRMREGHHIGKVVLTVPKPLDPDGTVLITGGSGTLARLVARHLVAHHGARHLVLASRQGPDSAGAERTREELAELGAEVTLAVCDVGERRQVARLLAAIPGERPLTAVVHAAGVLNDGVIEGTTAKQLDAVLRPKAVGAAHLDELTRDADLSAFVLFSSMAGVLGTAGQSGYAAANAFLDALARRRAAAGLPATSVAWGLWAEPSGMTGHLGAADLHRMNRLGLAALTSQAGLALLDSALTTGEPMLVAGRVDRDAIRGRAQDGTLPTLLRGMAHAPARPAAADGPAGVPGPARGLGELSDSERWPAVLDIVLTETAAVLGHAGPEAINPGRRFQSIGFDSLTSIELRNRLNTVTGLRLPSTLTFRHPTPDALAHHLLASLPTGGGRVNGAEDPAAPAGAADGQEATLGSLYREIAVRGRTKEAEMLVVGAAALRERFDASAGSGLLGGGREEPAWLSRGGEGPAHIAFPPLVPVEGTVQFAQLAERYRGTAELPVLRVPGFGAGEPLAASLDVLVHALAESTVRAAGPRPFTLVGYSTGGLLAHAVAARLEAQGVRPAGLVLLDTYVPDMMSAHLRRALDYELFERRRSFAALSFEAVTAAGIYTRMFHGWRPAPLHAPTLFVRPERFVPGSPESPMTADAEWRAYWPLPHDLAEVPGDHCTMMVEHGRATADVVYGWTAGLLSPEAMAVGEGRRA